MLYIFVVLDAALHLFFTVRRCPWSIQTWECITKFIVYFSCCSDTCRHVWTGNRVVCFWINFVVWTEIIFNTFLLWTCLTLFISLLLSVWIICCLAFYSSFSHSQSWIPSNAGPFPGSTKKLHPYLMPLLIIVIQDMPICDMQELL